jgi:hypothetical protein
VFSLRVPVLPTFEMVFNWLGIFVPSRSLYGMMVDFNATHVFHVSFALCSFCGMHAVVVLLDAVHAMNVGLTVPFGS